MKISNNRLSVVVCLSLLSASATIAFALAADRTLNSRSKLMAPEYSAPARKALETSGFTEVTSATELFSSQKSVELAPDGKPSEADPFSRPAKIIIDNKMSVGTGEYTYVPEFFASIVGDNGDVVKRPKFRFGLYSMPTLHQMPLNLVADNLQARYGGVRIGDLYYNVTEWGPSHQPTYYLRKYDIHTWELKEEITLKDPSLYADCMAVDPTTEYIYGCFRTNGHNMGSYEISLADFKNRSPYRLPALHKCTSDADRWVACTFTRDGQLWAINANGDLLKIDKTKGTGTSVGNTGVRAVDVASAFTDPDSGKIFFTAMDNDLKTCIYEIDTTTAKATPLLYYPDGLVFSGAVPGAPIPAAKAPGHISGVSFSFTDGSLSGSVSFTAPSKTYEGKTLTGNLTYTLTEGDNTLATGTVAAGRQATAQFSVSAAGMHDLTLSVSNTAGRSPRHFSHIHIGYDQPERLADVKLVYDRATGKATLSWEPVTKGVNKGFFNASDVRYRITDTKGAVITDNLNACSYTIDVPATPVLKRHAYRVQAIHHGIAAETRESNPAIPGSIQLPFNDDFNNIDSLPEYYHVINVAEDLNTWTTYSNLLMCHKSPLNIPADDWLFTPPLYLQGGKKYQIAADMASRFNVCTERIEVLWGDNNHPSAMTHVGIPPTELKPGGGQYVEYANRSFILVPPTTGYYYVGFHAISDADQGSIFLDNLSISDELVPGTPQAVTNLTLTPGANGSHRNTVSFTAPSLDVEGNKLQSISRIDIERKGEVIHSFTNPTPGATLSYEDYVRKGGWVEYLVAPYNANGKGQINRKSGFVGAFIPAPAKDLKAVETSKLGEVTLTWQPPTTDAYGRKLTSEDLFYALYTSRGITDDRLRDDLEGSSFTYQACDPSVQDFLMFGIAPISATGQGQAVWTDMIALGKGDPLPYSFSFSKADFERTQIIRRYINCDDGWQLADDSSFSSIKSADSDNGFAFFHASAPGNQGALITGKIELPAGKEPCLSVMVYNQGLIESLGRNTNTLEIQAGTGGGTWTTLRTVQVGQLPAVGWNKVLVPLGQFAGNHVQLQFITTNNTYPLAAIDAIRIEEVTDIDLALEALEAPEYTRIGQKETVKVTVRNNGGTPRKDYKVNLLINDAVSVTVDGAAAEVEGGDSKTIGIPLDIAPDFPDKCVIKAVVACAADKNEANNTSAEFTMNVGQPRFNIPRGLSADRQSDGVKLSWSEVSAEGNIPNPETESFESYTPWLANPDLSPWSLYDGDKGGIGGINGFAFPGQIQKGTQQSYWVVDDTAEGLNHTFLAHSGHRFLSQMYSADLSQSKFTPVVCDDRLISPRLFGCAQTISFYAKSYVYNQLETFEVLVSSTGNAPEDFKTLARVEEAGSDWHRYAYELPEGTTYFAIKCCSKNKFMFFIDDVECTSAITEPFSVVGYNIYRDGRLLNDKPVASPAFTDATLASDADATYYVTAVYNYGESCASAKVTVKGSGITLTEASALDIKAVYSPDGKQLPALRPGINIVILSDGSTRKVMIRK